MQNIPPPGQIPIDTTDFKSRFGRGGGSGSGCLWLVLIAIVVLIALWIVIVVTGVIA